MNVKEKKTAEFKIRVTETTKVHLLRMANLRKISVSEMMRNIAMEECANFFNSQPSTK